MTTEKPERLIDKTAAPTPEQIEKHVGKRNYSLWRALEEEIARRYPGVFVPDWLYGGKKHGWSLRYKKNRSFCTFIPEKNRFALCIVFGVEEQAKVEAIKEELQPTVREQYDASAVYHDGKWLLLGISGKADLKNVLTLLAVKRSPKKIK